jgi:F420-dependent oxidoreductase-like protein
VVYRFRRVRIGIFLAYWPWFSLEEQIELAKLADAEALDSVWVAEAWGQDAATVLARLSGETEQIGLGSGIFQIPARTPAMTAMTAMTLDRLSGGRFRLGLGVSGPQVSEGWHGVEFSRPLARTREYIEIVRMALAREGPLEYHGSEFQLPIEGTGLGKPLKMMTKPLRPDIPIYLGALGPKSIEQVAQIADGWLPFLFSPETAGELLGPVRASGRDIDVSPVVLISVDDDVDSARNMARPWLTMYLGGMGHKTKNFYVDAAERYGQGESARKVQELFMAGDRTGAAAALSPEIIDQSTICCTASELEGRVAAYADAGADTLLAMPFGDRPAIVRALAAMARTA